MKKLIKPFTLMLFVIIAACNMPNRLTVISENGKNTIELSLDSIGNLYYSIFSHGQPVIIKSSLAVETDLPDYSFNNGLTLVKEETQHINEAYELPTGKRSHYVNQCVEKTFTFGNAAKKELKVICRAYNDGVALRYEINKGGGITVKKEGTAFNLPARTVSWMMDYIPHYEHFYPERMLDTLNVKVLSYPALMRIDNKIWALLTEASVYDQPATHLIKDSNSASFTVGLPQPEYTVNNRWQSPWRTFIMGENLGVIVESTMVENLNPPSEIKDMSWIKPGVAVFPWWGDYLANSYIDTLKKYVDMAAEMKWQWIEFDVSLVGSPWRTAKLWETTGWLPEFTAYAASKGIKVYGWDEINVLKTPEGREHVYGSYKKLEIDGIKIDYIESDESYAMCFRDTALMDAAKEQLTVSFHGETLPRGQRRKWPNLMTAEAVRGAEYYTFKGNKSPTPEHNCTLPFTRNVVGPMDYTPVTFTIREENPRTTTYAHELALPVIFESGWTCMADRPAMYLNSPAKPLLQRLVSTWDETKFIDGYPGKFICIARRKGADWYLAAINADPSRIINVPLNFIKDGTYSITVYEDKEGEALTDVNIRQQQIKKGDTLQIQLMKNGGFSTIIDLSN